MYKLAKVISSVTPHDLHYVVDKKYDLHGTLAYWLVAEVTNGSESWVESIPVPADSNALGGSISAWMEECLDGLPRAVHWSEMNPVLSKHEEVYGDSDYLWTITETIMILKGTEKE